MAQPDPGQIRLSYDRARAICQQSGMTLQDIAELRPRFWDFHRHLVTTLDTATTTILTMHWNLCIGTIASFLPRRPDLLPLVEDLLAFKATGEYMLTEIGHGLDARNLETTATLMDDGSFDLHTPHQGAAKAMPPNSPWAGVPRICIVFAKLVANDIDCGVKPFIVKVAEANELCPGVKCQMLPKRSGARGLDHALTTFNHLRLGSEALLGVAKPAENRRLDFIKQISRVTVGTLALSLPTIPVLKQSAFIAGTYSCLRSVTNAKDGSLMPIIGFSTQHRPILQCLVQAQAFDAFATFAIDLFRDPTISMEVRHGVAATFKATTNGDTQKTLSEMVDRCGWRGLFGFSRIFELALALKGNSIAEGDYSVLCIRLVSEVLLGRYALPAASMNSILARHEAGVWREAREMVASHCMDGHRDEAFNTYILPRCRALVEATGHRMAYEAAHESKSMTPEAMDFFESVCMMSDPSWYCEHEGWTRQKLFGHDAKAAQVLFPQLSNMLTQTQAARWASAPILSGSSWNGFVDRLEVFEGPAQANPSKQEDKGVNKGYQVYLRQSKLIRVVKLKVIKFYKLLEL
ncbi:hypothetical protein B0I35DRAFT_357141 [Stachybotrys elegans]|uniref:Acyl-CoA oxidase C-alpha1 domain-containing protein n=1 Tax=Stachybotrys elegans TaxID=80388 RepID=A0A8K0SPG3_9HYPO|nr:hypothetical protein B0I35DRAFT_357141 [Stachybotrys elegans]